MAANYYLAFDFGASSGRAIIGKIENDKISLEEIHRFPNGPIQILGHLYWDFPYLFNELKKGITLAVKKGFPDLQGMGIDTWGVDFGLISKDNQLIGNPFCYRDSRTDGMLERALAKMPKEKIYEITGIQFMQFNSLFQLFSMVETGNHLLNIADKLLFMPDLFNFFLTGEKLNEYTIASTSQLLNAKEKNWAGDIFSGIGLPEKLFSPIIQPGTMIGDVLPEIKQETGIKRLEVIAPATHDTASAVVAVPALTGNWAYLSSGTWSLMGIEADAPIISDDSMRFNFTNEGGVNGKIRFLRNVMGLWLLQRCMFQWELDGKKVSYKEMDSLVETAQPFRSIINPDDAIFLNPPEMTKAIQEFCERSDQPVPRTRGEILRTIFESLALKYRFIMDVVNSVHDKKIDRLHIVGGGSQNQILNQFTANALGIPVIAGPAEATALGNIVVQAIAKKELNSVEEGRELIANSFELKEFTPENRNQWEEAYQRVKNLFR
ncbi:MAG: rhamnulokinase [Calditrichaeota bacterium]|nr:rhamnulokinase [Calditrichota bacterium]